MDKCELPADRSLRWKSAPIT